VQLVITNTQYKRNGGGDVVLSQIMCFVRNNNESGGQVVNMKGGNVRDFNDLQPNKKYL